MQLKKKTTTVIMCVICATFLLGTGITAFANEDEIGGNEVPIGSFYEISEDGETDSDEEITVGAFYEISEDDEEVSVGTSTNEKGEDVSIGTIEMVDEE